MPDFQTEGLFLAEEKMSGRRFPVRRMERLKKAFSQSFLRYTKRMPDHWQHPRPANWKGTPDVPSCGVCVVLAILSFATDEEDLVLRYVEFLGAVAPGLSAEEAAYARLILAPCAADHPGDPRFSALDSFLRQKECPPKTETYRRAKFIASGLRRGKNY